MDSKQRENTKEENEVRDAEIYKALTALDPWRPLEQNQPVVRTRGLNTFQFVKGMPEQSWVRDGDAIIQDNSFWRALAQAHGGTQLLWPIYKYQTFSFLSTVLDLGNTNLKRTHPRAVLYTVLNGHAGGRTSEHLKKKPADLIIQTRGDLDAPVSSELFQVVADLYSIELVVFYLVDSATIDKPHGIVPRGQHNHRQIFLSCYIPPSTKGDSTQPKSFYQPILPDVSEPWDFKFSAHMQGDRTRVSVKRCPFVFSAGRAGERVMPGIPEEMARVPPPPIFPPPVPVSVGQNELKVLFRGYRGPVDDGAMLVLEPKTAMDLRIGRRISIRKGREESLGRILSGQEREERMPSGSGSPAPPAGRVGGNRIRSGSSLGDSTESSRRKTSVSHGKTSLAARSRTSSLGSSPAPPARTKVTANRTRSGSSVSDSTESSRRKISISHHDRTPDTGRSRPPSVTPSASPSASTKKTAATPTPGWNPSTSVATGQIPIRTRTPSISKILKFATSGRTPALSLSENQFQPFIPNPPPPTPITMPTTPLPTTAKHKPESTVVSISNIPAPPSTTRRNSFSRPEVICQIRTPLPPPSPEVKDEGEGHEDVSEGVGKSSEESNGKPVVNPKRPPPAWARKNIVRYGEVPGGMRGRGNSG